MDFDYLGIPMVMVMVAIMEVAKLAGLPSKAIPPLNLVLAIAFCVIYLYPDDIKKGIFAGVLLSLSSMGLFSSVKAQLKK